MKHHNFRRYIWLVYLCLITSCDPLPNEEIVKELPTYYNEYLDARAKEIVGRKEHMEELGCRAIVFSRPSRYFTANASVVLSYTF